MGVTYFSKLVTLSSQNNVLTQYKQKLVQQRTLVAYMISIEGYDSFVVQIVLLQCVDNSSDLGIYIA
eukprot:COSAG01_NODE_55074_length_327_cov_1.723684_1_plen_66_part_01